MKQQHSLPESGSEPGRLPQRLVPGWVKAVIAMVSLLALAGYASPDMRAVYVAAWAACF